MSRQSKPLPQPLIKSSELKLTGDSNTTSINNPTVIGADPDFERSGDEIICPQCSTHFKSFSPSLAVTCPACGLSGFQFPDTVPTCAGCGTRGEWFIDDRVHWEL